MSYRLLLRLSREALMELQFDTTDMIMFKAS